MRDFRNAMVMAHAPRDALKARPSKPPQRSAGADREGVWLANWNILSAKIGAAAPRDDGEQTQARTGGLGRIRN
jgi:hypothetical protein